MASSIKLDDELEARVQTVATTRRRSAEWVMREAIEQYVEKEEARFELREEADASWLAYGKNGLHLTGDETRDWLATWGTADEAAAPPKCHE